MSAPVPPAPPAASVWLKDGALVALGVALLALAHLTGVFDGDAGMIAGAGAVALGAGIRGLVM